MKRASVLLAILLLCLFTACKSTNHQNSGTTQGGGDDDDSSTSTNTGGNSPEAYFTENVLPLFQNQCSNCHAPPFRGGQPGASLGIFIYSVSKDYLEIDKGVGPDANEMMFYLRGNLPHGSANDLCQGNSNNSPCFEVRVWWAMEAGGNGTGIALPIGSIDQVNSRGEVTGWAVDPNEQTAAVQVEFYIDGDINTGTLAGTELANKFYAGLGFPGDHGIRFPIPNAYRDGNSHTVTAYALDTDSGERSLLAGSPKSFRLYQPNAAARAFYNGTVVPKITAQCSNCHVQGTDVIYDYDQAFYMVQNPTPAAGGTANNFYMLNVTSGQLSHTGGNACSADLCADMRETWRRQFE